VNQSATAEELKRAYRKMARKYHPDVRREALFGQGEICRRAGDGLAG
jgi:DnaJ-class molecular chaperone